MKILYLAHRIPYPPNKGDKLRAFRQIRHLAQRHEVWCACFIDDPRDPQYVQPLRDICSGVVAVPLPRKTAVLRGLTGLLRGKTITESFYQSTKMKEALAQWSSSIDFDAVVAFSSGVAPYALSVPAKRHVLDLCDLDSRKWLDYAQGSRAPLKWLYTLEGRRLARREVEWIDQFNASIVITKAEGKSLEGVVPQGKVHIVGNGVDVPKLADGTDTIASPEPQAPGPVVGFVGVMDYKPNIDAVSWFVRHCWSGIRQVHPQATFRIIGRNPTRAVSRLASQLGVHVVGEVDRVGDEMQRIDVSVAPLQIARGLQNKVLEAMAHAKPIVLTSGAAEGIDATNGEHLLIADTPQATIRIVNRLLTAPKTPTTVGESARTFVRVNHAWQRELRIFEQIVTGIVDMRSMPRTGMTASPAYVTDADQRVRLFNAP